VTKNEKQHNTTTHYTEITITHGNCNNGT